MKLISNDLIKISVNLCIFFIGLWIFFEGMFLSQSNASSSLFQSEVTQDVEANSTHFTSSFQSNFIPLDTNRSNSTFDRMVFVLVDAFRSDFLFKEKNEMKFISSLLNEGKAFGFVAEAVAPTVTLPRIKALTCGGIPNFMDLLFNFNSEALKEDNWIFSLRKKGKRIHFFGDDTWIKLYPGQFDRFEGVSSFFVADTVEVDNNVTRHIKGEFDLWNSFVEKKERRVEEEGKEKEELQHPWDALILHYLGLDHIGHLEGPNSPLMPGKQREIDGILRDLFQKIGELDEKTKGKTLLVFCSDHGMNELGNHGGSSLGETSAVLVLASPHFNDKSKRSSSPLKVAQVDAVPTICSLLGISIPIQSLGRIIPSFFESIFGEEDYLKILWNNSQQQSRVLKSRGKDNLSLNRLFNEAQRSHEKYLNQRESKDYRDAIKNYNRFMEEIQDEWTQSSSQDSFALWFGIILLFISTIGFLSLLCTKLLEETPIKSLSHENVIKKDLLLLFMITPFTFMIWNGFCNQTEQNSPVCSSSLGFKSFIFLLVFASLVIARRDIEVVLAKSRSWKGSIRWDSLIVCTCIFLYFAGLLGSSTIEEEHQTFYFITTTLLLVQSWKDFRGKSKDLSSLLYSISLLFISKVMRSWNQTGNKWLGGPDIHKWLLKEENQFFCGVLFIFSSLFVLSLGLVSPNSIQSSLKRKTFKMLSFLASFGIVLYKMGLFPHVETAQFVYFCIFTMILVLLSLPKGENWISRIELYLITFSQLFLLLHKVPNAFLIVGFWVQTFLISLLNQKNEFWRSILTLRWMGYSSFFILGNSNGISTIDISGAYTGLSSYNEFVVGSLVAIIGLSGPLFFFLYGIQMNNNSQGNAIKSISMIFGFRSVVILIFSLFIATHRHHLFIWSVFSPKYIYEIAFTLFDVIQSLFLLLLIKR
eukprot:TRINITY_DN428_c0_g1_i1.p1 TRINITY_DN428_c0_g1~~TRINITY_DN428_c0_g1_i1.p1  ORF type:complete len:926 (+),score=242.77 TRINITY_DN428_c0_g1_i1:207-2984(+)